MRKILCSLLLLISCNVIAAPDYFVVENKSDYKIIVTYFLALNYYPQQPLDMVDNIKSDVIEAKSAGRVFVDEKYLSQNTMLFVKSVDILDKENKSIANKKFYKENDNSTAVNDYCDAYISTPIIHAFEFNVYNDNNFEIVTCKTESAAF